MIPRHPRLRPIAMRIATRVMGLLLAAVAFQFMLNALQAVTWHSAR